MALRKVGKIYHILYRDLNGKVRTVTTEESAKKKALAKESVWMSSLKAERQKRKRGFTFHLPGGSALPENSVAALDGNLKRRRLKLSDALGVYEKYYGHVSQEPGKYFRRFVKLSGLEYMDDVTTDIAFNYLTNTYKDRTGKTYNEARGALNMIFKRLLLQAGIEFSPFDKIGNKKHSGKHQRKLSEDEIKTLLAAADETMFTAILTAWFTGFRKSSVFVLDFSEIRDDAEHGGRYFRHLPPKSARFGRYVIVPIHPQLDEHILALPRKTGKIVGDCSERKGERAFKALCNTCGILDNEDGIVRFGSIRKSFISRCDESGMRRSATRGMAGHTSDNMTDLYSEDYAGTLPMKKFSRIELESM